MPPNSASRDDIADRVIMMGEASPEVGVTHKRAGSFEVPIAMPLAMVSWACPTVRWWPTG